MSHTQFAVRKSSGQFVAFDEDKLRRSLHRSGANDQLVNEVMQEVRGKVYENMPTKTLFKMAYKILKRFNQSAAGRYSLKQAMLQLGPSGYPFERFYAEVLHKQGYDTQTGVLMPGKCITHEIDVVAENENEMIVVECKYHPEAGAVSDVKVPLYIHSRFRDLAESPGFQKELAGRNLLTQMVTNTRFTDDAMSYGRCEGLTLISWDYPAGNGLRERIDETGLHPVTCLSTITRQEKTALLEKGIVLCSQLERQPGVLGRIGVPEGREKAILKEAAGICQFERKGGGGRI